MEQQLKKRIWGVVLWLTALAALIGVAQAGSLEPSAAPGPTMKTLDQIPPTWDQILPAAVRFQSALGGAAVLDKETGLVWEQSPDTTARDWGTAQLYCDGKPVGGRLGWRLPTIQELGSLVDRTQSPSLPSGHPFSSVLSSPTGYWSATADPTNSANGLGVEFNTGDTFRSGKGASVYVWCVRGGQGVDPQ